MRSSFLLHVSLRFIIGISYTGGFGDDGQHNYSPARTLDEEAIKRKMAVRRAERAAAGDPYIIYDGEDEYGKSPFLSLIFDLAWAQGF